MIPRILLTGATGYVGGRLLRSLEAEGIPVRCIARRPEVLAGRNAETTEVVAGDVLDPASLDGVMDGIETAYYLMHNLGAGGGFEAEEEASAAAFADAAKRDGVKRIIYLGGLCNVAEAERSPHLRSRLRAAERLRASGIPTIEFRASVILGSGSLSFELIRALVRRLPVMITPRWVSVMAQPIGIDEVVAYLKEAIDIPLDDHRIYEIGGTDRMCYGDLMLEYARQRGLKRLLIPVPFLTPRLSSLWLHLVTPLYSRVGRKLIESITVPSVVQDTAALRDFNVRPRPVAESIASALNNEDREYAETHWSSALSSTIHTPGWAGTVYGNRIVDCRSISVKAPPDEAFAVIQAIGGKTGWYYGNALWWIRGKLDRMLGGVGMQRGRRDSRTLRTGDVVDCWRVESVDAPRQLTLQAEMKLPGRAWLKFEVEPVEDGARITQTAIYDPIGWLGRIYWYSLYVIHQFVFAGMLRNIGAAAEALSSTRVKKDASAPV